MVNYNMGQYYAWINLKRLVRSLLKKYNNAPIYRFKYIPPKHSNRADIVPFEKWKGTRQRQQSSFNIILISIAFLSCLISRTVYLMLFDDYIGYYYHTKFPIASRSVELIYNDFTDFTDPFFDIVPKDRYQIPQIMPRLYELVTQRSKTIALHDEKVIQLRKQMDQYDKKHK